VPHPKIVRKHMGMRLGDDPPYVVKMPFGNESVAGASQELALWH
jgi:hypothetical protein